MFESFSAFGSFVQTPCGPRKSGMPDSVEMPAPVRPVTKPASRNQPAITSRSVGTAPEGSEVSSWFRPRSFSSAMSTTYGTHADLGLSSAMPYQCIGVECGRGGRAHGIRETTSSAGSLGTPGPSAVPRCDQQRGDVMSALWRDDAEPN